MRRVRDPQSEFLGEWFIYCCNVFDHSFSLDLNKMAQKRHVVLPPAKLTGVVRDERGRPVRVA